MPDYPQLVYLSVPELTAAAGGDPWQVDDTIQSGAPGEISELAESFYNAGVSMTQTSDEFAAAKKRFQAAWDRDDPAHPINDSVEVQRATQVLQLNRESITRVGVDLQNIAASLAEAQRSGHVSIGNLNGRLVQIDNTIASEIAQAQADGVQLDWSALKTAAVDATKQGLGELNSVRDAYGRQLSDARVEMAAEGYDSDPIDGAVSDNTRTVADQARADAEKYGADQRAADEALVNSPGPWTPEKQAAAGRLRDFNTVMSPNPDPEQVRYAGERLNDYNTAKFVGPLPRDPIFGRDARQRAQERLATQAMLEQGLGPMAPMDPNAATASLDMGEAKAGPSAPAATRSTRGCPTVGTICPANSPPPTRASSATSAKNWAPQGSGSTSSTWATTSPTAILRASASASSSEATGRPTWRRSAPRPLPGRYSGPKGRSSRW
jgi:hypothetical protein